MTWEAAAWLMLGGSTFLLFLGLPVAFSFIVINLIGAVLFLGGEAGLVQLARNSVGSVASFSLTPIPLFILMGEVLFHTGLAVKVIDGVERLIRQVPGRLAVVAVVAGTVFSAISGSTIATTAMLGSLMLPVMLARGADGAAGEFIGNLDIEIADRRHRAGPGTQSRLRRLHHRASQDESLARA